MITISEKKRFENKFVRGGIDECWRWDASLNDRGYGQFGAAGKIQKAHRVSWQIYVGDIPHGAFVLHKCDNPWCINPNHLYIGDQKQNMADKYDRGRANHPKGDSHAGSKLTETDVIEIYKIKQRGEMMQKQIAELFNVTPATISYVLNGKRWAHLTV